MDVDIVLFKDLPMEKGLVLIVSGGGNGAVVISHAPAIE